MKAVSDDQMPRDSMNRPILAGAGGVAKTKEIGGQDIHMQRFISILCPINEYLRRIPGDDDKLPYAGQITLVKLASDEDVLVDSEDFESAFNLFRMPPQWLVFFAYS